MFEILQQERKTRPSELETWFLSHPMEESRIAETKAAIAKMPPEQLKGLQRDSRAFQDFKKRVMALPEPAKK
jgi:predicted Zn-dependent protease